jgi:hypothetical protein
MSVYSGPETANTGLTLCLDAANTNSYAAPANGYWSNQFNGSSSLTLIGQQANAAFSLTGNFTIEGWIYLQTTNPATLFYAGNDAANGGYGFVYASGVINFAWAGFNNGVGSAAIAQNTWTHIAAVRSGSTITLYKNGISSGSATVASTLTPNADPAIGQNTRASLQYYWVGYISNFRLVKGTAVYTANFTPPTEPLTAIPGTSLLTCQSSTFVDNSTNAFPLTIAGTPVTSNVIPFVTATPTTPTTWLDVSGQGNNGTLFNSPTFSSTNSGSIVFNGTNQYVTGSITTINSWSMCLWYLSTDITSQAVFYPFSGTASATGLGFGGTFSVDTFNRWYFFDGTSSFSSSNTAVTTNVWYNLVVTKSSTTYNLYTNGTLSLTGTGVDLALTQYNLGRRGNGEWYAKGNIAQASIYNLALTADEVNQNFQALRGRYGI